MALVVDDQAADVAGRGVTFDSKAVHGGQAWIQGKVVVHMVIA
jgi:hypothetical protein